ncbi:MAG: alpha/beta fold hydrolase [Microthrixaceae bacterium]
MSLTSYRHDGCLFDVDDSGGGGDGQNGGNVETVILLHGFPQSRTSWRELTPQLVDRGYRVIAPDQRGYSPGARPRRRRDYTLDKLAGDVIALADAADVERFHVVGHDWGGAVAWALGANHSDRVASVTSLSTPHPQAMISSLMSSDQLLRSWYMLYFQLPVVPELMVTNPILAGRFKSMLLSSGLPAAPGGGECGDARSWFCERWVQLVSGTAAQPATELSASVKVPDALHLWRCGLRVGSQGRRTHPPLRGRTLQVRKSTRSGTLAARD